MEPLAGIRIRKTACAAGTAPDLGELEEPGEPAPLGEAKRGESENARRPGARLGNDRKGCGVICATVIVEEIEAGPVVDPARPGVDVEGIRAVRESGEKVHVQVRDVPFFVAVGNRCGSRVKSP